MKLPQERLQDDLSNLWELHDQIIPCCEEMKKHVVGEWYDSTNWKNEPIKSKSFPEGLGVEFISTHISSPHIVLSAEGQTYAKINYCPFCGEKIES